MYINYKLQLCSLRTHCTTKGKINTPCVHSHILPRVMKERCTPPQGGIRHPFATQCDKVTTFDIYSSHTT